LFEKYPRGAPLAGPAPLSGIHQVSVRTFAIASVVTAAVVLVGHYIWQRRRPPNPEASTSGAT
jgi:hypothetical protein